jgi:hypothetical protein
MASTNGVPMPRAWCVRKRTPRASAAPRWIEAAYLGRRLDERVAAGFRELHMRRSHLTHEDQKRIVRDQAAVLQLPQQAIDNLSILVPDEKEFEQNSWTL